VVMARPPCRWLLGREQRLDQMPLGVGQPRRDRWRRRSGAGGRCGRPAERAPRGVRAGGDPLVGPSPSGTAEPASGWSGDVYAGALRAYAALHGRPPQTATMHPTTAAVLGVSDGPATLSGLSRAPLVVTSLDYEGHTITFYY
jgi:hypothetical protein